MTDKQRQELLATALIALILGAMFLLPGCAHALPSASGAPAPPKDSAPDLTPMVEFVGRFGFAHGCPVGPMAIYTAAHVADTRPFDSSIALYPQRMGDASGREDTALPVYVDRGSDVALMKPAHNPLSRWFVRAVAAPEPGERLWTLGYRFDNRNVALQPKSVDTTVVRVIAGHVVLRHGARPGSSGACWVNARGEAVAVGVWDLSIAGQGEAPAGVAAGLWGPWRFDGEPQ